VLSLSLQVAGRKMNIEGPNPAKSKQSEMPFPAFWKVFYRVLKITKHPIKA
jgi:hypothetical protein